MNNNPFMEFADLFTGNPSSTMSKLFYLGSVSDIEPLAISLNEIPLYESNLFKFKNSGIFEVGDIVLLSPFYADDKTVTANKYILWGTIE